MLIITIQANGQDAMMTAIRARVKKYIYMEV